MGCQKAKWMLCIIGRSSCACDPNRQVSPQDKNIILKAYYTRKVGSGGSLACVTDVNSNFESGNQVYGRR